MSLNKDQEQLVGSLTGVIGCCVAPSGAPTQRNHLREAGDRKLRITFSDSDNSLDALRTDASGLGWHLSYSARPDRIVCPAPHHAEWSDKPWLHDAMLSWAPDTHEFSTDIHTSRSRGSVDLLTAMSITPFGIELSN